MSKVLSSKKDVDPATMSPIRAVAHRPTQTDVVLWIEARAAITDWQVAVTAADAVSPGHAAASSWPVDLSKNPKFTLANPRPGKRSRFGERARYRVWHETVGGLQPGCWYTVTARKGGRNIILATFRTIPVELPFTVLAASCYSVESDASGPWSSAFGKTVGTIFPRLSQVVSRLVGTTVEASKTGGLSVASAGLVGQRYSQLCRELQAARPDLKVLVGDQVYVDAPFSAFWFRHLSDSWIERHISHVYHRSWDRLGSFLTRGANVCTSDDHEYWNDFPDQPGLPWMRLRATPAESAMRTFGQKYRTAMQLTEPIWKFDIGEKGQRHLSFLSIDTRMNRTPVYSTSESESPQFMANEDLDTVCSWIADLNSPGVLALGQPLLSPPYKLLGNKVVADVNLPAYGDQFARLCRALTGSKVDILVLAGDVHFGRVAQVQVISKGQRGAKIVEVVSSPLALLHGAGSSFELPAPDELSRFPHAWFPEFTYLTGDVRAGSVEYKETIPREQATQKRQRISKGPESDHFMTVRFDARNDGHVTATIFAYLVRQPRTEGPPQLAWQRTIVLRGLESGTSDASH